MSEESDEYHAIQRLGALRRAHAGAFARSELPSGNSKGSSAPQANLCTEARQKAQTAAQRPVLLTGANHKTDRERLDAIHGLAITFRFAGGDIWSFVDQVVQLSKP